MASRAMTALLEAGVEAALLKGASFRQWLYRPGELRPSLDIDLLVSRSNLGLTREVIEGLGFRPAGDWGAIHHTHAVPFVDPATGSAIDLHRTLGLADIGVDAWAVLSPDFDSMMLNGTEVSVLSESGRCLHAALHAAQSLTRTSAKPIEDLERAIQLASATTWERASALAGQLGCSEWFAVGLSLAPSSSPLLDRLDLRVDPSMIRTRTSGRGLVRIAQQAASTSRWRDRARVLVGSAVPTRRRVRDRYLWADQSIAHTVAAYMVWACKVAVDAPRGVVAVLVATKRRRRS